MLGTHHCSLLAARGAGVRKMKWRPCSALPCPPLAGQAVPGRAAAILAAGLEQPRASSEGSTGRMCCSHKNSTEINRYREEENEREGWQSRAFFISAHKREGGTGGGAGSTAVKGTQGHVSSSQEQVTAACPGGAGSGVWFTQLLSARLVPAWH